MTSKRTIGRRSSSKKQYALRDSEGKFKDIRKYRKAHGQDTRRKSKSERTMERTAERLSRVMKRLAKS
jgi:hypothetical protein